MKKLISATLALTMLVTPLVSSACYADDATEKNVRYVQNETYKDENLSKVQNFTACVAAGAVALTCTTAATLKLFENYLPESLKAKLPFLFKKAQEDNESNKTLETTPEPTAVETADVTNSATAEVTKPATKNSPDVAISNLNTKKAEPVKPADVTNSATAKVTKPATKNSPEVSDTHKSTEKSKSETTATVSKVSEKLVPNTPPNDCDETAAPGSSDTVDTNSFLGRMKNYTVTAWGGVTGFVKQHSEAVKYVLEGTIVIAMILISHASGKKAGIEAGEKAAQERLKEKLEGLKGALGTYFAKGTGGRKDQRTVMLQWVKEVLSLGSVTLPDSVQELLKGQEQK